MEIKLKRTIAILLAVCFLVSLTATAVSATIGDGHDLRSPRFAGNSVLEACYDNERVLQKGTTDYSVYIIQNALMDLGYSIPDGPTYYFGDQTEAAVKAFQTDYGISPISGMVGPKTMTTLDYRYA